MAAVRQTIANTLATPLRLTPEAAAEAVIRLANTHMAGAIRMVSLSLGADPRDFALFAFGGAGPLHASALARELSIPRVLIPARPGLTNALGCVCADLRQDFVRTLNRPVKALDMAEVHGILALQQAEGRARIDAAGIALTGIDTTHAADMQFVGQTHILRVPLPSGKPTQHDLQQGFEAVYHARFHVNLPEIRANLVNLVTAVTGRRPEVDLSRLIDPARRETWLVDAQTGTRPVWFDDWIETAIYDRERLPLDAVIMGPAVLEQMDTTILLHPGDRAGQDEDGNLIVEVGR
jgi:N-methylhydantoinase A